jgi:hypothetical protein
LDLVCLFDPLLHNADRLQQHADLLQGGGYLYVLWIVHVALGQVTMQQVDVPLVVRIVGGDVVGADAIGRHHVVAGTETAHPRLDLQYSPERLVTGDQKVVALRGGAVLGVVDLLVRSVHPDAQHLDEDAAAAGYVVDARLRQVGQVNAVGLAGKDGDRFHLGLLLTALRRAHR